MNAKIHDTLWKLPFRGTPAAPMVIERLQDALGIRLPGEYLELLGAMDGCEGPVGSASYVVLYSVARVMVRNAGDLIQEHFPGVVVFASDGGDIAYGFDTRLPEMPIVETSFSDPTAFPPRVVGKSLAEWLEYLLAYEPG